MSLSLVVDGGGTSTRAGIFRDGRLLARGSGGPSNPTAAGYDQAITSILAAVRSAAGLVDDGMPLRPFPFARAWFGLSGLDTPASVPIAHRRVCEAFGAAPERVTVTNDAHLLSAAIALSPHERIKTGVCLIAGTGSIAMAFEVVDGELPRELGRAGGYGHLLGDEGSAWWVGCEALRRVLAIKVENRRLRTSQCDIEPSDAFINRLLAHFNSPTLADLLDQAVGVNDGEAARKYRIADCARLIQAAAFPQEARWPHHAPAAFGGEADLFALRILQDAVAELVVLIDALVQRFHLKPSESALVIAGGMWSSPGFRQLLQCGQWAAIEQVDEPLLVAGAALGREG